MDGLSDKGTRSLEFQRYMRYMKLISVMRLVSVRYKMFNFKELIIITIKAQ